jgi:ribose transport system permease protein
MKRLLGVLVLVLALYGAVMLSGSGARSASNQQEIALRLGFYGILTLGVGVLILSGGIDLSIGSLVGLGSVCFGRLLILLVPPWQAALLIVAGGALLGLCHGLLVTKLRLQPFLVTLCGLFIYRGLARVLSPQGSMGIILDTEDLERFDRGLHSRMEADPDLFDSLSERLKELNLQSEKLRDLLYSGTPLRLPNVFVLLLLLAAAVGLFLHFTKYGRYLYAIGANEEAARYAGINTDNYKILAYVICSALAGLGSVVYMLNNRTVNPTSAGSLLELYAITGAVLGGCSLRGGEGSVPGMLLGAAALPLLRQMCSFGGVSDELEYVVIGAALLVGTISDELLKRPELGKTVWRRLTFGPLAAGRAVWALFVKGRKPDGG